MKKSLIFLYILSTVYSVGYGQVSLDSVLRLNIPVVVVYTVNQEVPTATKVDAPEGCTGTGAINKTKVSGSVTILLQKDTLYHSGDYVKGKQGMQISLRGNTSAFALKPPYKIKLEKKANLIVDDKNGCEDKEWLLLREDVTCFNSFVGFWLNERIGLQWTPRHQYVNLFFNDEYTGLYLLCESVKRNNDGRLVVDKEDGAIFEYDPYFWNEPFYIESALGRMGTSVMAYTFKYPAVEDFTAEKEAYYQSLFATFESSILDGTYDQYIDVPSFAKWLLAHDILGTADGAGANIFMTQKDDASPISMANMWDFDTILRQPYWGNQHYRYFFPLLLESENGAFRQEYLRLWEELSSTIVTEMLTCIDTFVSSPVGQSVKISRQYDMNKYAFMRTTLDDEVANVHRYMTERKLWLDVAMAELETIGIEETSWQQKDEVDYYNLFGRKVSSSALCDHFIIRLYKATGRVEKVFMKHH